VYDAACALISVVDGANSIAEVPSPTIILSFVASNAILPLAVDVVDESVSVGVVNVLFVSV
jgi:hypothetical protein